MAKLTGTPRCPPTVPGAPLVSEENFRRFQFYLKYGTPRSREEIMANSPKPCKVHDEWHGTAWTTRTTTLSFPRWVYKPTSAINLAGSPVKTEVAGNEGQPMGRNPTPESTRATAKVEMSVPAKRGAVELKKEPAKTRKAGPAADKGTRFHAPMTKKEPAKTRKAVPIKVTPTADKGTRSHATVMKTTPDSVRKPAIVKTSPAGAVGSVLRHKKELETKKLAGTPRGPSQGARNGAVLPAKKVVARTPPSLKPQSAKTKLVGVREGTVIKKKSTVVVGKEQVKKTTLEKVLERGLIVKKRWSFFYNPGTFLGWLKPGYWSSVTTEDEIRYIPTSRPSSPNLTGPNVPPSSLPIWNKEERRWMHITPIVKRDNFFRRHLPRSNERATPQKGCVKSGTKDHSLPPKEARFADEDSLEDFREYVTNVDGRTVYNPRFVGQANYPRDKQKDIFSEPTDFQTLDRNFIDRYQAVYEWCRRERNEDLWRGALTDAAFLAGDRLPTQHLYGNRKHALSLDEYLPMTVGLKDIYSRITKTPSGLRLDGRNYVRGKKIRKLLPWVPATIKERPRRGPEDDTSPEFEAYLVQKKELNEMIAETNLLVSSP